MSPSNLHAPEIPRLKCMDFSCHKKTWVLFPGGLWFFKQQRSNRGRSTKQHSPVSTILPPCAQLEEGTPFSSEWVLFGSSSCPRWRQLSTVPSWLLSQLISLCWTPRRTQRCGTADSSVLGAKQEVDSCFLLVTHTVYPQLSRGFQSSLCRDTSDYTENPIRWKQRFQKISQVILASIPFS